MNRHIEKGVNIKKEQVLQKTTEQVLRSAAALYRKNLLDADLDIDLGDIDSFTNFTLQAGEAIAGLHESLSVTTGVSRLLESDRLWLMKLSGKARELVDDHDLYGIGMLMYIRGSRLDEPNKLEKLIEELYPPKPEESPYVNPAVGE